MRPQPLIAVRDVEASSLWYQRLLGCRSDHGGPEYERLTHDGVLVLQLHRWEVEHHHGPIGNPNAKPYGNGVLLWFEVDDFDAALARAEDLKAEIVLPIVDNSQDMTEIEAAIAPALTRPGAIPAYLIRDHGLYAWGKDLDEAERVLEATEWLIAAELAERTFRESAS